MKKILGIVAIAATCSLASCGGGGFESDVRKTAEMMCKGQKLEEAVKKDSTKQKELDALEKEGQEFSKKMEEKYAEKMKADTSMAAKARKIVDEVMEKCK